MGQSHVVAMEQSHVEAREQSHVVAMGQSHVEAMGQSHVVAMGQSHVVAMGQSHVVGNSPQVSILAKSAYAVLSGGYILGNKPITAKEWLCACNIKIKRGKVILFKSLKADWSTQSGISYKVGEETIAPDWDASSPDECGKGLHFCPTVAQARTFKDEKVYVACEVALKDIGTLPAFAMYPDKIRAKACKTLYQVDDKGERINEEE